MSNVVYVQHALPGEAVNVELRDHPGQFVAYVPQSALTAAEDQLQQARELLRELVTLKDMFDEGFGASIRMTADTERTKMDYLQRHPLAWDAARAFLAQGTT